MSRRPPHVLGDIRTQGPLRLDPMSAPSTTELSEVTRDDASLRRFLHGLPGVDQVGVEQRASNLATRSIKKASKLWAIDTAISMVDLTTLEGADTPGKVRTLAAKARRPDPEYPEVPHVGAVCIYPDMVATAVAGVGATEIDMVIDRGAFLSGRYGQVYEEIVAIKQACARPDGHSAHLKVILETG